MCVHERDRETGVESRESSLNVLARHSHFPHKIPLLPAVRVLPQTTGCEVMSTPYNRLRDDAQHAAGYEVLRLSRHFAHKMPLLPAVRVLPHAQQPAGYEPLRNIQHVMSGRDRRL